MFSMLNVTLLYHL